MTADRDTGRPGTVTVAGHGTAQGVPDRMVIAIAVECRASAVGAAYEQAGRRMAAVTGTLRDSGVRAAQIDTGALSVRTDLSWQDGTSRVVGYIATTALTVTLTHRDAPGTETDRPDPAQIVADAVAAGGDDVRLGGLHHMFADPARLLTRARDAAWDNAVDKARQYARRAGRELGPVLEITENPRSTTGPQRGGVQPMAATKSSPAPVDPGETELSADLQVTWQLN